MPIGSERDRVLYGLSAKRSPLHRYTWIRVAVGVVFTLVPAVLTAARAGVPGTRIEAALVPACCAEHAAEGP